MDWEAADRVLLEELEQDLGQKTQQAGTHLACRPGCTECCIGPFAITSLDKLRLQKGLRLLRASNPEKANAVESRASEQVRLLTDFPGDPTRGLLAEADDVQDQFFAAHSQLPCPALDPVTGYCDLYEWRPVTCRTYGLPVLSGDEKLEPCRLCFLEASQEEIEACRAWPDPLGIEDGVLVQLERRGYNGETTVAFALAERRQVGMKELNNNLVLDEVFRQPVAVVFKHSTRCPISRGAEREVERFLEDVPEVPVYVVDVIRDRALSREFADRTGVPHESPQTIILTDGSVAWSGSHYQVTAAAIRKHLPA